MDSIWVSDLSTCTIVINNGRSIALTHLLFEKKEEEGKKEQGRVGRKKELKKKNSLTYSIIILFPFLEITGGRLQSRILLACL